MGRKRRRGDRPAALPGPAEPAPALRAESVAGASALGALAESAPSVPPAAACPTNVSGSGRATTIGRGVQGGGPGGVVSRTSTAFGAPVGRGESPAGGHGWIVAGGAGRVHRGEKRGR